jgi:transposase
MIEVKEVLYRWTQGMGKKTIARSLGLSRNTIREILNQAIGFGLQQNSSIETLDLVVEQLQGQRSKKKTNPMGVQAKLSQYHEQVHDWFNMPHITVTQMVRLFAELGETISETSLRTYVRAHFDSKPKTTVHMVTIPGQQAQVDFGYVGLMKDPITLKMKKAYAFIMTLSHSRHRFVRFVFNQDSKTWIDCHIRAFHFFGGVPHTVLLDNLKAGVIKPDIYDPILNRAYSELERHYGFIIDPAKVRIARHKGKVERSVTIVRQQVLAGREFESINAANDRALTWCKDEIAHRVTRTTGRTPWDLYTSEDKPSLKALPEQDFECPIWQEGLVHKDQHVVFNGSFYSVPHHYVHQQVSVRATDKVVQFFSDMKLIKTHVRSLKKGAWITDEFDYPEGARKFLQQDEEYCLGAAKEIGTATVELISSILTPSSLTRRRKTQALLRLADTYGNQRLENACRRALDFGNTTYDSVKTILVKNLDKLSENSRSLVSKDQLSKGAYLRPASEFSVFQESCI